MHATHLVIDGGSAGCVMAARLPQVVGAENLFIAGASVMVKVSRTNSNVPTIMIAGRIAELVRQHAMS